MGVDPDRVTDFFQLSSHHDATLSGRLFQDIALPEHGRRQCSDASQHAAVLLDTRLDQVEIPGFAAVVFEEQESYDVKHAD